jgi:hypothetical protein
MTQPFSLVRRRSAAWCAGIALAAGFLLVTPPVHADDGDIGTLFKVNDDDPIKSTPPEAERNEHPIEFGYYIQDLIAHAEGAAHRKDWAHAAKLYEAIARIAPKASMAYSRLCKVYEELGRIEVAAANCLRATQLPGTIVYDHLEFIRLTLQKKKLTDGDVARIDASIAHVRESVPGIAPSAAAAASAAASASAASGAVPVPSALPTSPDERRALADELLRRAAEKKNAEAVAVSSAHLAVDVEVLACRLAVRLADEKRLAECTTALKQLHADDRLLLSFEWSQALIARDRAGAASILERARAAHVSPALLDAMVDEQEHAFGAAGLIRRIKHLGKPVIFGIAALFIAAGAITLWWVNWGSKRKKAEPSSGSA